MPMFICNSCMNSEKSACNFKCGNGCDILTKITQEAFNREYGHDSCLDIKMTQLIDEDQWTCTIPVDNGSFIILGWYKDKPYIESAFIMDECDMTPLTYNDVLKYLTPIME